MSEKTMENEIRLLREEIQMLRHEVSRLRAQGATPFMPFTDFNEFLNRRSHAGTS